MDDVDDPEGPDAKHIIIIKAPLAKLLRDPQHLGIYRDTIKTINRVVTATYLFARFIFVHAYEEDDNFNVDNHLGKTVLSILCHLNDLCQGIRLASCFQ